MYLKSTPLERISWPLLEECRLEKVEESRTLDFKRDAPDLNIKEKRRELLEDICGFANAHGGLLLYGVEEKRQGSEKLAIIAGLPGVMIEEESFEAYKSRLEDLVRGSFDPRFAGIAFRRINSPNGNPVVALGVERSPSAPHRVISNGSREFMLRMMKSTEKMDVEQIKETLRRSIAAGSVAESRVRVAAERILRLLQSSPPPNRTVLLWSIMVPVFPGAFSYPIGSPQAEQALLKHKESHELLGNLQLTYDHLGVLLEVVFPEEGIAFPVDRVYRDGTVERLDFVDCAYPNDHNQLKVTLINQAGLAQSLKRNVEVLTTLRRDLGIGGFLLACSGLFPAEGKTIQQVYKNTETPRATLWERLRQIAVSWLVTEPQELTDEFLGRHVREAANLFWQAAGHKVCGAFDADGKWTGGFG